MYTWRKADIAQASNSPVCTGIIHTRLSSIIEAILSSPVLLSRDSRDNSQLLAQRPTHGDQIWAQIGQIRVFFRSDSVHFCLGESLFEPKSDSRGPRS